MQGIGNAIKISKCNPIFNSSSKAQILYGWINLELYEVKRQEELFICMCSKLQFECIYMFSTLVLSAILTPSL